jgi:hypothetical protein
MQAIRPICDRPPAAAWSPDLPRRFFSVTGPREGTMLDRITGSVDRSGHPAMGFLLPARNLPPWARDRSMIAFRQRAAG